MNNHINLYIPVNSLGYGVVGFNIWKSLRKNTKVTVWPIGNVTFPCHIDQDTYNNFVGDVGNGVRVEHDPTIKVWHEHQMAERIGKGPLIAYPFFELNEFDARRKNHLSSVDIIVVSSKWAANVVRNQLPNYPSESIYVVPCGVDSTIFNPQLSTINDSKCIFFNCGKWEYRKGHDILADVFKRTFAAHSDVELWVMADNPFLSAEETQYWVEMYQAHNIRILPRVASQQELASVMGQVHCGVFPVRAEGWNLEVLELMAIGKYVIVTDYSGHTEYCNHNNSILLPCDVFEPAYDGKWFFNHGTWAKLDPDALASAMKTVYNRWKEDPSQPNEAGIVTASRYTWEKTAYGLNNICSKISGKCCSTGACACT